MGVTRGLRSKEERKHNTGSIGRHAMQCHRQLSLFFGVVHTLSPEIQDAIQHSWGPRLGGH